MYLKTILNYQDCINEDAILMRQNFITTLSADYNHTIIETCMVSRNHFVRANLTDFKDGGK